MFEFVESPVYENWFKKHYPRNSIIICSPYVKQAALQRVFDDYNIEERSGDLSIRVLIRGNIEEFTTSKSSDVNVLNMFFGLSKFDISKFRRITNLHMKAYLIDYKYLLITSGNLTNSGMFATSGKENFEGGIATDDEAIIEKFLEYFNHIWKQSECLEDFYSEIMEGYMEYSASPRPIERQKDRQTYIIKSVKEGDSTPIKRYTLHDLPPAARIITLKETLAALYDTQKPLTMVELGQELRRRKGYDDLDNDINNRKYGEEKGNLAVYLGLAIRTLCKNVFVYELSKLGKRYLQLSVEERCAYLQKQIESKEAIMELIALSNDPNFVLKDYVNRNYEGQVSTLQRKIKPVQSLIDIYNNKNMHML